MVDLRRAFDRMFDDIRPVRFVTGAANGGSAEGGYFPVDLYETENDVVIKASLPGVKPDDIDVQVTGQVVTLKAQSSDETEDKGQNWYRRERRSGAYVRQFQLPTEVQADNASADFEHGVLKLSLPKAEAVKPKSIKVGTTKPAIEASKN
jgi:HSP20 family protein